MQDPFLLAEHLLQEGVSILELVPSQLGGLLEALESQRQTWRAGRWLLVTGEAMSASLCERWWKQQAEIRLLNAYGPT